MYQSSTIYRWLALAGIVAIAVAVRAWRLDTAVLTHDEAFSWRLTQYPVGELCTRTGLDVHPPLYYIVLKAWDSVFGDSVCAMRGLSVLSGVAAVLVMHALCLEALRGIAASSDQARRAVQTSALFAALLVALSSGQVDASRNARMYGLGVLLAGASAWLLLRACRGEDGRWSWWAAYGIAAALFCYTHNYAFFTLFGQGLFLAGSLLWAGGHPWANRRSSIFLGFSYAALLAFILYLPLVPVLSEQMRQVRENYWMQQVDTQILEEALFAFSAGMPYEGKSVTWVWLGLLLLAAVFALWRSPSAAAFFLLPAFCPIVLSVSLSLISGRSIFHAHLLVFGQYFLLGFWAVVWVSLPGWLERAALAIALTGAAVAGMAAHLDSVPDRSPGIVEGAAFLKENAEPGDELWTGSPWELNQWRYYLHQAGASDVKVRCRHSFPGKGHMIHIASISAEEVIWNDADKQPSPQRVWVTAPHGAPRPEMRQVLSRDFGRQGPRSWSLTLFEPAKD